MDASLWIDCNLSVHKLIILPVWLCCQLVMLVAFEILLHTLLMKERKICIRNYKHQSQGEGQSMFKVFQDRGQEERVTRTSSVPESGVREQSILKRR